MKPPPAVRKADALLLTGGGSRRMGVDKATLSVGGETLACRIGRLLAGSCTSVVEVGDGTTGFPAVREIPPGSGPLAALVAGWSELKHRGGEGPVVVMACDLPNLTGALVDLLVAFPTDASVIPVVGRRAQPLCARWSAADLDHAAELFSAGERSVSAAVPEDAQFISENVWGATVPAEAFVDADTPDEFARASASAVPDRAELPGAVFPGAATPGFGALAEWIDITEDELPASRAMEWVTLPHCGAVATFSGTVRDNSEGREGVTDLVYEAFEGPAIDRMKRVAFHARTLWPTIGRIAILHRLGHLEVGDVAIVVSVSAPHREEAFASAKFILDTVKTSVPIWKHETWDQGEGWGTSAHDIIEPESALPDGFPSIARDAPE